MTTSEIGILIAIIVYMVGVVGIGVYFAKKTVPQMIFTLVDESLVLLLLL
jgi:hypothetical protein